MGGQYIEPMRWPAPPCLRLPRRLPSWPALPAQCEVCRSWNEGALCAECLARFAPAGPRCGRCGLRVASAATPCGACLREPPPFERAVVAFDYGFPWDRLITACKFEGRAELAVVLARPLAAAVRRAGAQAPPVDAIVPVPLSSARLAERGFNQAWELARHVGRALRVPADAGLLLRAIDTPHQAALSRPERERNLRAAFAPTPSGRARLAGRRVALVDDVMTTGATAREAAAALRRGGAAAVDLWVLARTPEPGDGASD
jgi:ComF family protein